MHALAWAAIQLQICIDARADSTVVLYSLQCRIAMTLKVQILVKRLCTRHYLLRSPDCEAFEQVQVVAHPLPALLHVDQPLNTHSQSVLPAFAAVPLGQEEQLPAAAML
jgi:hypothetical protein